MLPSADIETLICSLKLVCPYSIDVINKLVNRFDVHVRCIIIKYKSTLNMFGIIVTFAEYDRVVPVCTVFHGQFALCHMHVL